MLKDIIAEINAEIDALYAKHAITDDVQKRINILSEIQGLLKAQSKLLKAHLNIKY